MAWETAAPACPGGRATQCGNTDLAVRAGGIALPARPGPMDWPDTASRALCGLAGSRASPAPGEVRSVAGACRRRPPGGRAAGLGDVGAHLRLQHRPRHRALGQDHVVELARVDARAQRLFGLLAQLQALQFAELVARRLRRPGDVAVDLGGRSDE